VSETKLGHYQLEGKSADGEKSGRVELASCDSHLDFTVSGTRRGGRYATRPITLWLVAICNEIDWDENGSGFIRGKGKLLRPAFDHLDKDDTIGIAHWCDNETFKIDSARQGCGWSVG
jgi:hypothetical protein